MLKITHSIIYYYITILDEVGSLKFLLINED
jgi:hypothetical protein